MYVDMALDELYEHGADAEGIGLYQKQRELDHREQELAWHERLELHNIERPLQEWIEDQLPGSSTDDGASF